MKFTERGHIKLRAFQHSNNQYTFEVEDTGPGISKENQTVIFEPFQQDTEGFRQGGTGLGLAIARRQVELMGGRLNINSTLEEGTRFFFTGAALILRKAVAERAPKPDHILS